MLRLDVLLLLLGMSLVTYIPRMLPAAFVNKFNIGGKVEKFLKLIPYTAMATLIFPGILSTDPANMWIGAVGGAVAAIMAAKKCPMILCVFGAILTNFVIYFFIL